LKTARGLSSAGSTIVLLVLGITMTKTLLAIFAAHTAPKHPKFTVNVN
jgi:hypothetical protein